jgi:glycosyltransferase involved in cell wall biosynthesis
MITVSGPAPCGVGGLGLVLSAVVDRARAEGDLERYYTAGTSGAADDAQVVSTPLAPWLFRYTPARFSAARKAWIGAELFDRAVARALVPGQTFVAFAGHALHSFRRARQLGYERLELVAANSHVDHVRERHAAAHRLHPIERSWLDERQQRKFRCEYAEADAIHVLSQYSWDTFVAAGVSTELLHRVPVRAADRFAPNRHASGGRFHVVYVGALTVAKGVPVLLDAFEWFDDPDARLTLVGGWTSRGMRRWLASRLQRDPRISIRPGDPLPHLQSADVYVHPSWDDGFAFAASEAQACGVPVVVTQDTGMKEEVREGVDGWIVPTGDAEAIRERLSAVRSAGRA